MQYELESFQICVRIPIEEQTKLDSLDWLEGALENYKSYEAEADPFSRRSWTSGL